MLIWAIAVLFEVFIQFGACAQVSAIFHASNVAHCTHDPLSIWTWSNNCMCGAQHDGVSGTYSCGQWATAQVSGAPFRSWRCSSTAQHMKCCAQRQCAQGGKHVHIHAV